MAWPVTAASQWMCDKRYSPGSSPNSARHFLSVPLTSYCISLLRTFILRYFSAHNNISRVCGEGWVGDLPINNNTEVIITKLLFRSTRFVELHKKLLIK